MGGGGGRNKTRQKVGGDVGRKTTGKDRATAGKGQDQEKITTGQKRNDKDRRVKKRIQMK
jgi:hypothetical protein